MTSESDKPEALWGWTATPPALWTDAEFEMQERWFAFLAYGGPLPIPPEDYARHWALEGPGRPEIWPPVSDGGPVAQIRPEEREARHAPT